jgi:hypothetical protein
MDHDTRLLDVLPEPWKDIAVDREEILRATAEMDDGSVAAMPSSFPTSVSTPTRQQQQGLVTPQQSPHLTCQSPDKSPGYHSLDGDASDQHKRAVLLCFNENVRTAEDVFRCHNEFIRDTAHASHLQLSAHEWRIFFGNEAANATFLWGNIGIPVPFGEAASHHLMDAPGRLSTEEVGKFRTTWCTKRYEHEHELCGFAHVEVNGGWLRRNPRIQPYADELCQAVTVVGDQRVSDQCVVIINECPHGKSCQYAHSMEELIYHPRRYKMRVCSSGGRPGGCSLGEVCPNFHPMETYRFPKKIDTRSSRHGKHSHHSSSGGASSSNKTQGVVPSPSPILYCHPAPVSSFEEHLNLPGLQSLFRRQSFVTRTILRKNGYACSYTNFGDDSGLVDASMNRPKPTNTRGLPVVRL